MATRVNKKTTRSKTAPSNKTMRKKTKTAPARAGSPSASAATLAALQALDEKLDRPIDISVANVLAEHTELLVLHADVKKELVDYSRLEAAAFRDLAARGKLLDASQRHWLATRRRTADTALVEARDTAESIEEDIFDALRYFCSEDAEVQLRLDEIDVGDDDPDTVQDLRDLADLHDAHAAKLKKARLPKDIAARARAAATDLETLTAARGRDNPSTTALGLRNRAYWSLRALVDDIRAAGRHVYRHDRRRLKWFRASSTRSNQRTAVRTKRKAKKEQEPTPVPA